MNTPITLVLGALTATAIILTVIAAGSADRGLERDLACHDTLHGNPTPLGCRLPDGTILRPWQIPTEAPR